MDEHDDFTDYTDRELLMALADVEERCWHGKARSAKALTTEHHGRQNNINWHRAQRNYANACLLSHAIMGEVMRRADIYAEEDSE